MLKINGALLTLLLTILGCAPAPQALAENGWQLSMVSASDNGVIEIGDKSRFEVVLKNISTEGKRFWKPTNSWGYYALYFDVQDSSGNVLKISKKAISWRKNAPTYMEMPGGGSFVFKANLADESWKMPELMAGKYKIKAVISVSADSKSKLLGVWTGKIESKDYLVLVSHY